MSQSLTDLLAGNRRFCSQERESLFEVERRPIAAALACTDERIVPQTVFDHPPGKIYCVRMAGNVYTPEVAGSLEIAVLRLGCPLLLVLGHTDCTAVSMARSRERVEGSAYEITRRIHSAVGHLPPEASLVRAVEENVVHVVREMRERNRIFREREREGLLAIAGAICELESGRVRVLQDAVAS